MRDGSVLKVLDGTHSASGAEGGERRADAGRGKPVLNQQLRDEERLSNIPHFLPALNFILHDVQLDVSSPCP